jgi:hypothetical protein
MHVHVLTHPYQPEVVAVQVEAVLLAAIALVGHIVIY